MSEPRFLIVRLGSLGDIVHTFPPVAALRETFPSADIVWLTHARWQCLVESSSLASAIWTVEPRALGSLREIIGRIRTVPWTAAIDYQGLWKSAALPFLGDVRRRIGFSSQTVREFGVPWLYTDRVRATARHIVEQNGELSVRAGAKNPVADVVLRIAPEDDAAVREFLQARAIDRYVVLSPGGGWRSKCWPAERFRALSEKIQESLGLPCVVNCGQGEEDLVNETSSHGPGAAIAYHGRLGPLMALLRRAACIVAGDTGPLHLGVALGTPAVALFGPTDPGRNGPYRMNRISGSVRGTDIVLRVPGTVTTHAREKDTHPAMLALQVDIVFDAVRRSIGAAL